MEVEKPKKERGREGGRKRARTEKEEIREKKGKVCIASAL